MADYEDDALGDEEAAEAPDPDEPTAEEERAAEVPGPEAEEKPQEEQEQPEVDPRDKRIEDLNKANRQARFKARQAREHSEALGRQQQAMQQRLDTFMTRLAEAQGLDVSDLVPQAKKIPDAAEAPLDHLKAHIAEMLQPLQQGLTALQQQQQADRLDQQAQAIEAYVEADEAAFTGEQPDYPAAADYALENIFARPVWQDAKNRFPDADEDELAEHVERSLSAVIARLKIDMAHQGRSLARETYQLALRRGWQPNGNGAQPAARADRRPTTGAAGELRRNLARAPAVGSGAAPRKGPVLSVEALSRMDDDEFDEMTKGDRWKKILAQLGQ